MDGLIHKLELTPEELNTIISFLGEGKINDFYSLYTKLINTREEQQKAYQESKVKELEENKTTDSQPLKAVD